MALGAYLVGLAPEIYWLDSSEFVTASWELGIAHAPGHPIAAIWGRLFCLVPVGSITFRVGLAAAVAAAFALVRCSQITQLLYERGGDTPARASRWVGPLGATLLAGSYGLVIHAIRPEVYALQCALSLSLILEVLRAQFSRIGVRAKHLTAAAFWAGLSLTNHHLLAFSIIIPCALFVLLLLPSLQRPWRWFGVALFVVVVGLSVYAYLPLRATHHPLSNWGAPNTWSRFVWTVSARAFAKSTAHFSLSSLPELLFALADELRFFGLFVALGGIYLCLRLSELRRAALLVVTCIAFGVFVRALVGFDPATPDDYGYLASSTALLSVFAALFVALLVSRIPALTHARAPWLGGVTLALFFATALFASEKYSLAAFVDTRATYGELLDNLPPRARWVSSYFQTAFATAYLQKVEGTRPDLLWVHRHFLAYPGYREDVLAREPEWSSDLGDTDVTPTENATYVFEYDVDLASALVPRSQVVPRVSWLRYADGQSRRFIGWQAILSFHRLCVPSDLTPDVGARDAAEAEATSLFGTSDTISAIRQGCGTEMARKLVLTDRH